ncbi:hypothetical protein Hdeb2414_s0003g00093371 [Helianthus debilis subsp. tardiflorus]
MNNIYQTRYTNWYRLLRFPVPVLPGFTLKYRYRTIPYRACSVSIPTFGDFRYRYRFDTGRCQAHC